MYIAKYKYFNNPEGYQVYGYINRKYIANIFTVLAKKGLFEVRALLVGDSNGQVLYFGTKEECLNYMKAFAVTDIKDEFSYPEPEGVVNLYSKE